MTKINIGGLKQSASMARIENAITKKEFHFVCDMEQTSYISPANHNKLLSIIAKVNQWYFS